MTVGLISLSAAARLGASNGAQINLGGGDTVPANFINVLKMMSYSFNNKADPGVLDAQGYPTSAPASLIALTTSSAIWLGVEYTLSWPSTRTFTMTFLGTNNVVASTNATIAGGGGGNLTVTSQTGLAGSVRFTLSGLSIQFPSTGTYAAGSGEVALYRTSDAAGYASGEIFTPEFISVLRGLNLKTIRTMGWSFDLSIRSNETRWAYRASPTCLSWITPRYLPATWAGSITGTDVYTAPAAPDTPLTGWVDGETIQGNVLNAATKLQITGAVSNGGNVQLTITSNLGGNPTAPLSNGQSVWVIGVLGTTEANAKTTILTVDTGTQITINVPFVHTYVSGGGFVVTQTLSIAGKSGGAKFIADETGSPIFYGLSESVASTAGLATYIYDAILDVVVWRPGGIVSSTPMEAQCNLANKVNANLWSVIPYTAGDDYVTQWATAAYNNLNASLCFYPEYSNEVWNTGFAGTFLCVARGAALGFPDFARQVHGWYGLRVRQIMGNLIPPVWAGRSNKLRRTLAFQAAGDSGTLTYRMRGVDLAPSGTSTGVGNALYNSYTGSANYTVSPHRPIDVVEVTGYAPYASGANLMGPDTTGGFAPGALQAPYLQNLVNLWDGGSTAAAIASVDDDVRQGRTSVQTVTASGTTFTTPADHGFTVNSSQVAFQVTAGTSYSGLIAGALYRVSSAPTTKTFTIQPFVNGFASGSNVNAGSAGSGTVTVGWVGWVSPTGGATSRNIQTMMALNSNWYWFGEWLAASFDGDRPGGMSALRVEQYEGAIEPVGPTAAQCTTLGLTGTNPAASIAAAILAWKNDPSAAATQLLYFNQFMGTDSNKPATFGLMAHSKTPAHLVLPGGGTYSLLSGNLPNSTAYQLYNGFASFTGVT